MSAAVRAATQRRRHAAWRVARTLGIALAGTLLGACVPIGFKAQNMFAALFG